MSFSTTSVNAFCWNILVSETHSLPGADSSIFNSLELAGAIEMNGLAPKEFQESYKEVLHKAWDHKK